VIGPMYGIIAKEIIFSKDWFFRGKEEYISIIN
jgi:hypothetical protein